MEQNESVKASANETPVAPPPPGDCVIITKETGYCLLFGKRKIINSERVPNICSPKT